MQTVLCWAEHLSSVLASILQLGIRRHSETAFSCGFQSGGQEELSAGICCTLCLCCLSQGFCCGDRAPWPEATWEKKSLSPQVLLLIEKVMVGTQGRNLESRAKADTVEEWRLLPYSLWIARISY